MEYKDHVCHHHLNVTMLDRMLGHHINLIQAIMHGSNQPVDQRVMLVICTHNTPNLG